MRIIGLTGKAGAGKDTVADYLCERHGFARYAMASPLKRMLEVIGVDCTTRETKELPHPVFGVSPRRFAQTLGTEWGRQTIRDDIWLLCADRAIAEIEDKCRRLHGWAYYNYGGVVITDIRFDNEAKWLLSRGGLLWEIRRGEAPKVEAHVSEAGLSVFPTRVIENNGLILELHSAVEVALR
jgi:hypothetical protein